MRFDCYNISVVFNLLIIEILATRQRNAREAQNEYNTNGYDADNIELFEIISDPGTNASTYESKQIAQRRSS